MQMSVVKTVNDYILLTLFFGSLLKIALAYQGLTEITTDL